MILLGIVINKPKTSHIVSFLSYTSYYVWDQNTKQVSQTYT
jgi:hypothetical protein